jgi:DNA (cytosine-5)-methyltransferase 1
MSRLRTISLYSGAGGLDHGFIQAGFNVLWANEIDPWACKTYEENIGSHVVCGDVLETSLPAGMAADIVIGGPPCQGFSVIGKMRADDPRSKHVFNFLDVVQRVGAMGFVMENVKALAVSPRWAAVRERLIEQAERLGFTVRLFVLNAADFEVPQSRQRMFLIGLKGAVPHAPPPVSADSPITVRQAFGSLPSFGSPGNDSVVGARITPAVNPVMRPSPFRGSLLFNGSGRPLHLDSPAKTIPASMGGNATPIIDQDELENDAEPWVVGYHRRLLTGGSPLKRAPRRLRRITLEEAAALQSFPASWTIHGPRVAQLRQVGNAVPPNLALHVARAVRRAISERADGNRVAAVPQSKVRVAA